MTGQPAQTDVSPAQRRREVQDELAALSRPELVGLALVLMELLADWLPDRRRRRAAIVAKLDEIRRER